MSKILIVDDSSFIRLRLNKILAKQKHQIVEAGSSKEAVETFKKEKPDLVLLDIIMPDGEEAGVHVLKEILKVNPDAKIVMLTAVGYDEIINECKSVGAKEYLIKPFNEEEVLGLVEKYL
ncbi:MAG: response regulator [Parcubacteria group bacterium]